MESRSPEKLGQRVTKEFGSELDESEAVKGSDTAATAIDTLTEEGDAATASEHWVEEGDAATTSEVEEGNATQLDRELESTEAQEAPWFDIY